MSRTADALRLAAGPVIAQGLSRLGYGLLLPQMRSDLDWSYSQAGSLNAVNAVGYLVGSIAALSVCRAWGVRRAFRAALVVSAVCLAATAATSSLLVILVIRFVLGVTGGVCFIAGAAMLAERRDAPRRALSPLTIYLAGVGIGVALSGIVAPIPVAVVSGESGWRLSWVLLAALAVAFTAAAWNAGSEPSVGREEPARRFARRVWPVLLAYTSFGVGYAGYTTFVPTYFAARTHVGTAGLGIMWVLLGMLAVTGVVGWDRGRPSGASWLGLTLIVSMAGTAAGASIPLLSSGIVAVLASVVIFGLLFLVVISSVIETGQRAVPELGGGVVAVLTVGFAIGQCAGPILAGLASDSAAGVSRGLAVSAMFLWIAVALCTPLGLLARWLRGGADRQRERPC